MTGTHGPSTTKAGWACTSPETSGHPDDLLPQQTQRQGWGWGGGRVGGPFSERGPRGSPGSWARAHAPPSIAQTSVSVWTRPSLPAPPPLSVPLPSPRRGTWPPPQPSPLGPQPASGRGDHQPPSTAPLPAPPPLPGSSLPHGPDAGGLQAPSGAVLRGPSVSAGVTALPAGVSSQTVPPSVSQS